MLPTSDLPIPAPRFSEILFRIASVPPHQLTDIEARLLAITKEMMVNCLILVRVEDGLSQVSPQDPITTDQMTRAMTLAFAAAVEIEKPLRDIRDALGSGR